MNNLEEIIKQYGDFSDALVLEFSYFGNNIEAGNNGAIEIVISCYNISRRANREIIRLRINKITKWRFNLVENGNSLSIYSALLKRQGDIIILDFFPILGDELEFDPESDFYVFGRDIHSEVVVRYDAT
jgi:hypothetical protein